MEQAPKCQEAPNHWWSSIVSTHQQGWVKWVMKGNLRPYTIDSQCLFWPKIWSADRWRQNRIVSLDRWSLKVHWWVWCLECEGGRIVTYLCEWLTVRLWETSIHWPSRRWKHAETRTQPKRQSRRECPRERPLRTTYQEIQRPCTTKDSATTIHSTHLDRTINCHLHEKGAVKVHDERRGAFV